MTKAKRKAIKQPKAPPQVAKLSKRLLDQLGPRPARYIVWDEALKGFGLRIDPTGRKTFLVRYRASTPPKAGEKRPLRQINVGRLGTVTLDEARSKARALLGAAASGGDPLGERQKARQLGLTVDQVCDWYLSEGEAGRLLGRKGRPIRASTLAMDRSRIDTHVRPLMGKKAVAGLKIPDLEAMQASIAAGKTSKQPKGKRRRGGVATGGSGVAARTLGMVATIFAHAKRSGLIAENPAIGARKLAGKRKRARLSLDELRALGQAMRAATDENPVALDAIRLILLTGFRRAEVLSRVGSQILPGGGVDFPDTKTESQVRPVGKPALDLLQSRYRAVGNIPTAWLFPAERGEGHFVGLPRVLARLCKSAGLPKTTTLHTLRHTFASVAGDMGFSELSIGGLLGHASGSVTGGYVHLDTLLVAAADRVSASIAAALDGKEPAKVIPIRSEAG